MKAPVTLEGKRYQSLLQLLRTAESLWNDSRIFFVRWNLSPSQFNVLKLLLDHPGGFTQIELSRLLIMHRSNVSGLLDRLEKRGLVQRRDAQSDRRAYNVVLTAAGRRLLGKILPVYYQTAEQIWGKTSPARARQLAAELETIAISAERIVAQTRKPKTKGTQ
jgi:DNA-binding MarR family transcriptional regulator